MSLKDDLLRNRKIFELLTGPWDGAADTAGAARQKPLSPPVADIGYERAPSKMLDPPAQTVETFSLEYGRAVKHETGMAPSFSPPEDIEFPELSESTAKSFADPLESLYHQLEVEARRSSQLRCEEEF